VAPHQTGFASNGIRLGFSYNTPHWGLCVEVAACEAEEEADEADGPGVIFPDEKIDQHGRDLAAVPAERRSG
jgi:hypothetical protein